MLAALEIAHDFGVAPHQVGLCRVLHVVALLSMTHNHPNPNRITVDA